MKERCQNAENAPNETENEAENDTEYEDDENEQVQTDFSKTQCSDFEHLGYVCVPEWKCIGGKVENSTQRQSWRGQRANLRPQKSGIFQPWLKRCRGWRKVCCKKPTKPKVKGKPLAKKVKICPGEFTGLRPVPGDCSKFANCWKGAATIQSCGPGTHFNSKHQVCDWPSKANCTLTSLEISTSSVVKVSNDVNSSEEDDNLEQNSGSKMIIFFFVKRRK